MDDKMREWKKQEERDERQWLYEEHNQIDIDLGILPKNAPSMSTAQFNAYKEWEESMVALIAFTKNIRRIK